jgi:hypothetical protein
MLSRATTHDDGKHLSTNDLKASNPSLNARDLMEGEKLSTGESQTNGDNVENVLYSLSIK